MFHPTPSKPSPEPCLQRLKNETRARHGALESRSVLLDPALSRERYLDCLCRFYGYYAPLELRLRGSPGWAEAGFAYAARYKSALLAQDLLALGLLPARLHGLPSCSALPTVETTAQLFGCLYVLEGATLGGQIITRHLQASLGLTPESGAAFFAGYGAQTGSRWKEFGAHLTAFALQSGAGDAIVASANSTFETLDHWLYPERITAQWVPAPLQATYPVPSPDSPRHAAASSP
ncbi:biliverdin-producing heme oxygenase [Rhodoferax lacus]|nr:biliverdin-producing heme oxygenase [Rhodoferax lacus]